MSIIDAKYKGNYQGAGDWLGELINEHCYDKPEKGKATLNLENLFSMAEDNGVDCGEWRAQAERKNAPGRLRMTIGNMLRARAKRRHGLFAGGKWHDAPEEFLKDAEGNIAEPTEDHEGNKLAKPKADAPQADDPKPASNKKGGKKATADA